MDEYLMDESQTPRKGGCCSLRPLRSVSECFDSGLRRSRSQPLPIQGEVRASDQGLVARFSLRLRGGRIAGVSFKASTCVTLVAYCEVLAELVEGLVLAEAVRLSTSHLVAQLPGVPVAKRDRAALAWSAFVAAVHEAVLATEVRQEGL
jgi:NifU-like protein involved in Fe-S cluster formation